jgi:hypothetical protein
MMLIAAGSMYAQAPAEKKSGGKVAPGSPVDINNASAAELEKVPGIGQATAEKIIAGRPYRSVEDLSKAGLPPKQVQTLAPMLKVDSSSSPAPAGKTGPLVAPITGSSASPTTPQTCPGGQVWVNTQTKVYHVQGDRYYGNTKHGKCMEEGDAQKAGYHRSKQKS